MSGPLVSLVMPVWRPNPGWLRDAVAAVLGQTHANLELIVVDDGSPEPVEPLLAGIDDPRLRVVRIEHGGISRARNAGCDEFRGDFLRFVDADDVVLPDSTEHLLRLAAGRDDLITYGATGVCDSELRHRWTMAADVQGDAAAACLLGEFAVRPFSMLFPRGVVERTGAWDEESTVSEDWDWVLRAVELAPVAGDGKILTWYRKHSSSATRDYEAGERGARRVLDRYLERHPEQRGSALERRARARLDVVGARVLLTRRRPLAAARRLARGLARDPRALGPELRQGLPALRAALRR